MAENKKKPEIRFVGFTDDWEQRKVIEVAPLQRGFDLPKEQMEEGCYPVVMSNGINGYHSKYKAKAPGVVTGRSGTIGNIHYIEHNYWPHNTGLWVTDFKGNDPRYVYYMYTNLDLNRFGTGSGVPTLNRNDVHEAGVWMPKIEEQRKISTILYKLDNLITLHQRKYDKLQNIKKAMLEKMFPKNGSNVPEIRFAGFTDAWEQRELGDFGKATGGTSIESEFIQDGKYKVISIGSYSETSIYSDQGIRVNKTNRTESRILNKDDLTMILNDKTASGNIIGRVLLIDADNSYVYNQRTERIEVDKNKFVPQFLYQLLNADNIRSKIIRAAQGNTQIYVNWSTVSDLQYFIPISKFEQQKIGEYFKNLDNLITLHQHELEKLKNIKKACLKKMFV